MSNFNNFSNLHRYSLEKGSKKHHCPDCNKKTFVLYIDTETGDYLPEQYGRCDRESKCAYKLNPYLDGYAKRYRNRKRATVWNFRTTGSHSEIKQYHSPHLNPYFLILKPSNEHYSPNAMKRTRLYKTYSIKCNFLLKLMR